MITSSQDPLGDERNSKSDEEEKITHTEQIGNMPHEPEAEPDVVSDPSLNVRQGSDWTDEGGATLDGPATAESTRESTANND